MKVIAVVGLVVLVTAATLAAAETATLGIVARFPWSASVQLTFPIGLAIEAGVAATGPAIFAVKTYLDAWSIGEVALIPAIGLGGGIAFLPGDLVAWGLYALAGLELPVPRTRISLLADVGVTLPWPAGTLHLGVQAGIRFDF